VPDFLLVFQTPEAWVSLLTLTALEVVLGIDNIVFIAILTGKLPEEKQARTRTIGLAGAMITRILLLLMLGWIMGLTEPFYTLDWPLAQLHVELSGKSVILLGGGLFLIGKASHEIFERLEVKAEEASGPSGAKAVSWVIFQIMMIDIVFSLDSVITAVGMAQHVIVMILAVVIAVIIMMLFAGRISDFIHRHPSMKILALSFLILIGVLLVAEGFGQHVSKGYIYFAMAFALLVEVVNIRVRKVGELVPVKLHEEYEEPEG
jgi:predicted tellurium resistance membrane protein TerC